MRITLVRSILQIKQTCNQYHSLLFSQILYFSSSSSCLFTSPSSRFPPCPLHCPLTLLLSSPLPPHFTLVHSPPPSLSPLSSPLPPHFLPCPLPSPLTFSLVLSPPPHFLSCPLPSLCPLSSPLPPLLSPFSFPSFLTSFLTFTLSLFRVLSEQN